MKKIILCCSSMILIFLVGCSATPNKIITNSNDATPEKMVTLISDTSTFEEVASYRWGTFGSGNEYGFYEVLPNDDGTKSIVFTDYTTAKQVYLCGQINCEHDSDKCTSWISTKEINATPAALSNNLIMIYEAKGDAPRIEISNLDGSDKKVLYTFASGTRMDTGAIANDKHLIFNVREVNASTNYLVKSCIKAISLDGKHIVDLYTSIEKETSGEEDVPQKNTFMLGTSNTGIIVKELTNSKYEIIENNEEATTANMLNSISHRIIEIPFDGSNVKELLNFKQGEYFEEALGGYLYYFKNNNDNTISLLKSGGGIEETVVIKDFIQTNLGDLFVNAKLEDFSIEKYAENYIFVNMFYDSYKSENGDAEAVYKTFAINVLTGEISEITMSNHYRATLMPVQIVDTINDNLLLTHCIIKDTFEDKSKLATTERTFGIISVNDYIANKNNFKIVETLSKLS